MCSGHNARSLFTMRLQIFSKPDMAASRSLKKLIKLKLKIFWLCLLTYFRTDKAHAHVRSKQQAQKFENSLVDWILFTYFDLLRQEPAEQYTLKYRISRQTENKRFLKIQPPLCNQIAIKNNKAFYFRIPVCLMEEFPLL